MGITENDLIRAGLAEDHEKWLGLQQSSTAIWALVAVFAAIGTAIAGVTWVVSAYSKAQVDRIEREAALFTLNYENSLLQQSPRVWPNDFLIKQGWVSSKGNELITVWSKSIPETSRVLQSVDIQVRTGQETLADARVLSFGSGYVWPYGESDNVLEDGVNEVMILEALEGSKFSEFVRSTEGKPVHLVGIGLESGHNELGSDEDPRRLLSDNRAQSLVYAAWLNFKENRIKSKASYRALGLGRNVKTVAKGSSEERLQRSAALVAVRLISNDTIQLNMKDALEHILRNKAVSHIDVSKYEYCDGMAYRLSGALVFEGSGSDVWKPEGPTAQEALKERNCRP